MDSRVAQLIADIQYETSIGAEVDASMIRNDIVSLFGDVPSEADRVALLMTFCATMGVVKKDLASQGRDVQALEAARISQMRVFFTQESSQSGAPDPGELARVVQREVEAGRLPQDDPFVHAAAAGGRIVKDAATAAKPVTPRTSEPTLPRKGWWSRTFGA